MRKYLPHLSFFIITFVLLLFSVHYHKLAFPESSPQFLLRKSEVPAKADALALTLGLPPEAYQRVVTFDEDTFAKYFIELRYGLKRLQEEVGSGVNIWRWSVRYFLPGQKEEFTINLDTEGRLVGFEHIIAEKTKRPQLSRAAALKLAKSFISRYVTQHPLDKLKLIETGEQQKVGHHVYSFTWERLDRQWEDGKYCLDLEVHGDRVGKFNEHLDVPEIWQRDFLKKRSANRIFQAFASTASVLLGLGFLAMFIMMAVRQQISWRGFPYRWVVPVGFVILAAQFSQFPEVLAGYSTTDNIHSFLAGYVLQATYTTLLGLLGFVALAFMADAFWGRAFPGKVSVRALLSGRGLATKEALRSISLAFLLAALSFAYVTIYYIAGRHIGFWTPSSIDQAKVLTSYFPALEALSIGISAAWTEEFMFRVLGLIFLYRLTGSRWLAIITTAAIWGFMHSSYPQMPGYARGIELTLEGIMLGWVVTRFGVLTTLISHCLFNTWLGAIVAWHSGSNFHMMMAVVVSVWPLGLWLKGRYEAMKRGRYMTTEELAQVSMPPATQPEKAAAVIGIVPLEMTRKGWMVLLLVIAVAGLASFFLPAKPLSDLGKIYITRVEARQQADAFLSKTVGIDPASFHRVAERYSYMVGSDLDYLLEHADAQTVARLRRQYLYQDYWQVRYFKAEQRNTYTVYLKPDGGLSLVSRSVAETEPGAQLGEAEAIAVAEVFLRERLKLQPDQYHYVRHDMKQLKQRRDFEVTFESRVWRIGESKLRWNVSLLGDQVNNFSTYVKLPEDYLRQKETQGWRDVVRELLGDIISTAYLLGSLIIFIILVARRYVDWRASLLFGLVFVLFDLLLFVNQGPYLLAGYSTTQSMLNYLAGKGTDLVVQLVMSYMKGVVIFAMLMGLIGWLTGTRGCLVLFSRDNLISCQRWLQGIVLGISGVALLWVLQQVAYATQLLFSAKGLLAWETVKLSGMLPGIEVILSGLKAGFTSGIGAGIIALAAVLLWRKHRNILLFLALVVILESSLGQWQSTIEGVHAVFFETLGIALKLYIFLRLFRFNLYAYFFMFYYQSLLPTALIMGEKAWPVYALDCLMVWSAVVLPLLVCFVVPRLLRALGNGNGSGGIKPLNVRQ